MIQVKGTGEEPEGAEAVAGLLERKGSGRRRSGLASEELRRIHQ